MSRTTIVLFAAAVLLSMEVYFFENTAAPWIGVGHVFRDGQIVAEEIVEVEIQRRIEEADVEAGADPRPILLRREPAPEGWWIAEPIRVRAFHPRVMGIVYEIVDLVRIAEAPATTAAFPKGPEIRVRVKTSEGHEATIEVGIDHPDSSLRYCYVRVDGEVFVARQQFRKTLTVSLNELRSRALFPVAAQDASRLVVEGDSRFAKRMERVSDTPRWRLKEPLDALADTELTESLLKDMNSWTVVDFVSDDGSTSEKLAPFGLAEPQATVRVRRIDGDVVVLEIGKEYSTEAFRGVYVRHAGEPFVYSTHAELLDRLLVPAEEYRSRFVFEFGLESVKRLRLEGWGSAVLLDGIVEESAQPEQGEEAAPRLGPPRNWLVKDTASGSVAPGDSDRIGILVSTLKKLPIQKFVDADEPLASLGLAPPRGTMTLTLTNDQQAELFLGDYCEDPDYREFRYHYAAIPGEPGAYLVQTELPEYLREGPQAFRNRAISAWNVAEITEIAIQDGDSSWFLGRVPGEPWSLAFNTPLLSARELKQAAVDGLMDRLDRQTFRVTRFVPNPGDFAALGIELLSSRRSVTAHQPAGLPGFRKLVLGVPVDGAIPSEVHARVDLDSLPPFTLLEDDVPRRFDALVDHLRDITGEKK